MAQRHTVPDTIAAIATAPGEAAISIVRVSGPDSLMIADRVFQCGKGAPPSRRAPGSFLHGHVLSGEEPAKGQEEDNSNRVLVDEVILLLYRAPRSYTREDSVEFQGHGGSIAARRILRAVLDAGARLAEPGEFTRRAFINGRIDLLQAEAVLDLIRARSDHAASAALEQLDGQRSQDINRLYEKLLTATADIEASLDFLEGELPPDMAGKTTAKIRACKQEVQTMLAAWDEGLLLREGATVVISGRPNVGKSTLLNCMLGIDRAIVTHIPGTTRDLIEETLVMDGIPVRLMDTAGLRVTNCQIEQEGIDRAHSAMKAADIVIYVVDASAVLEADDLNNLERVDAGRTMVVLNKSDLGMVARTGVLNRFSTVVCSLTNGKGVDEIRATLMAMLHRGPGRELQAATGERHRRLLLAVSADLDQALGAIEGGDARISECAAILRCALESLGGMTGRTYYAEMLDSIFARFCVGK